MGRPSSSPDLNDLRYNVGPCIDGATRTSFWLNTRLHGECLLWTGTKDKNGYGRFSLGWLLGPFRAHRLAYEMLIGPIPLSLVLDHLCRNPSCVNPHHLEPVTNRENIRRGDGWAGLNARKTHCKRGHPLSGENLYETPKGRHCKSCQRVRLQQWQERLKAKRRNA